MKLILLLLAVLTLSAACTPAKEGAASPSPDQEVQPKETAPENNNK